MYNAYIGRSIYLQSLEDLLLLCISIYTYIYDSVYIFIYKNLVYLYVMYTMKNLSGIWESYPRLPSAGVPLSLQYTFLGFSSLFIFYPCLNAMWTTIRHRFYRHTAVYSSYSCRYVCYNIGIIYTHDVHNLYIYTARVFFEIWISNIILYSRTYRHFQKKIFFSRHVS